MFTNHKRTGQPFWVIGGAILIVIGCAQDPDEGALTGTKDVTQITSSLVTGWGNCPPFATNAVCACTDDNMLGTCGIFDINTRFYMNLSLSPYSSWNDVISSLVVGPAAKTKLCQNAGGAGSCKIQYGSGPNGYGVSSLTEFWNVFGWPKLNDAISTLRVDNATDGACQNPGANQVAIFDDINYNAGTAGDCVILDVGTYNNPFTNPTSGYSGGGYGLNNDVISSIKVGSGAGVNLFVDFNLTGSELSTTTSIPDLRANGFNDVTTSLQVW